MVELISLLKKEEHFGSENEVPLMWFINNDRIEYVNYDKVHFSHLHLLEPPFDPLDSLFGFIVTPSMVYRSNPSRTKKINSMSPYRTSNTKKTTKKGSYDSKQNA